MLTVGPALAASGPVEFGLSEFQAANATRKWPVKVKTELSLEPPESFRIEPYTAGGGRVSGGDLRGLMYGLIEAAEQLRSLGRLKAAHSTPATPLRAVRLTLAPGDMDQPWFSSEFFWRSYFQALARSRFNRFDLALPRMPEQPPTRIQWLSQLAANYAIDFTLGLPEPSGDSASLRARLTSLLAACPLIRGIEIEAGSAPLDLYRDGALRAVETAGRRVTLDLHNASTRADLDSILAQAVTEFSLPVRVSSPLGCKDITSLPDGSCYWALRETTVPEAESFRDRVADFISGGSAGFEIEAPRLEGDSPVALSAPGAFYWIWGRLSYDPKAPASPPSQPPPSQPPAAPKPVGPPKPVSPAKPAPQKKQ